MKLINLEVFGLKNFKDEQLLIDFALQKMVRKNSVPGEVNQILPDLFFSNSFSIYGENATGKSLVINIIKDVNDFLLNDKVIRDKYYYKEIVKFDVIYLINDYLINFIFEYDTVTYTLKYFNVYKKTYIRSYYINDYLYEFGDEHLLYDKYDSDIVRELFDLNEVTINYSLLEKILRKCDVNIKNIIINDNEFSLIYKNGIHYEDSINNIKQHVASSTYYMYKYLKEILKSLTSGEILLIDDINKNISLILIKEILNIFQDEEINSNYSTLIFTTNNVHVLDYFTRNDCIYYLENNNTINIKVLSELIKRNEISKSNYLSKNSKKINLIESIKSK